MRVYIYENMLICFFSELKSLVTCHLGEKTTYKPIISNNPPFSMLWCKENKLVCWDYTFFLMIIRKLSNTISTQVLYVLWQAKDGNYFRKGGVFLKYFIYIFI